MKPADSLHQPDLQAIFFDLDGTLLDTAPDMVGALNELRAERSAAPLEYQHARAHVSNGALGLLAIGFPELSPEHREAFRARYLELYAARLTQATVLFPGMAELLHRLDAAGLAWGVVTNKPAGLTEPLLRQLDLLPRCACVVSGDSLPERKPHPGPLLHAAARVGAAAQHSVYVGDAARDIQAGKAAGMRTIAAAYGYIPPGEHAEHWQADFAVDSAGALLTLLRKLGAVDAASSDLR